MKYIWSSSSGRIELAFSSLDECEACAHPGPCDADVEALAEESAIAEQLGKLDPDTLARELKEYGAWDAEQLTDHEQNLIRLLWIASNDVAENPDDYAQGEEAQS